MKVVIDTNDYISALIGASHRRKLEQVLLNDEIEILADMILLGEIKEVAYRDKFRKYVSLQDVDAYITLLQRRLKPVEVTSVVNASPDPDDNFLLALALDGGADFLITGDKSDLLVLKEFNRIPIITLGKFLEQIS
jgi:uncharacterized protein